MAREDVLLQVLLAVAGVRAVRALEGLHSRVDDQVSVEEEAPLAAAEARLAHGALEEALLRGRRLLQWLAGRVLGVPRALRGAEVERTQAQQQALIVLSWRK